MDQSINSIILRFYEINQTQTNEKKINKIQNSHMRLCLHSFLIYPSLPYNLILAAIHGS